MVHLQIVVQKFLTPEELAAYNAEPIVLAPWDQWLFANGRNDLIGWAIAESYWFI